MVLMRICDCSQFIGGRVVSKLGLRPRNSLRSCIYHLIENICTLLPPRLQDCLQHLSQFLPPPPNFQRDFFPPAEPDDIFRVPYPEFESYLSCLNHLDQSPSPALSPPPFPSTSQPIFSQPSLSPRTDFSSPQPRFPSVQSPQSSLLPTVSHKRQATSHNSSPVQLNERDVRTDEWVTMCKLYFSFQTELFLINFIRIEQRLESVEKRLNDVTMSSRIHERWGGVFFEIPKGVLTVLGVLTETSPGLMHDVKHPDHYRKLFRRLRPDITFIFISKDLYLLSYFSILLVQ